MLEGSSTELAVLSQPSSPRWNQQQPGQPPRSGASSWFLPSAASSRPATPTSGAAAAATGSLQAWRSQQLLQQLPQQQPSRFSRAASAAVRGSSVASGAALPHAISLPLPAWPAAEAGSAAAAGTDQQPDGAQQQVDVAEQRSSQDGPSGRPRRTVRCSSTVSLSGWHLPSEAQPAGAEAEASISCMQPAQQPSPQPPSPQPPSPQALAAAAAWAPGYIAAAAAAAVPSRQQQQPDSPRVPLSGRRSGAASGTVTPRLCSLSNLAGAGASAGGSLQVTPRARSLRVAGSQQVGCSFSFRHVAYACLGCLLLHAHMVTRCPPRRPSSPGVAAYKQHTLRKPQPGLCGPAAAGRAAGGGSGQRRPAEPGELCGGRWEGNRHTCNFMGRPCICDY